ncbi:hypothetical protein F3Y22_tig00110485pilonHSYRG00064 [Hibiscus syriacus]|uniref:1-phosphatidylinositol 4-kinase n=1 Tax=Hibiscus syriacus TaxID=106335 RepID=A0A6A3AH63_HIBSY|nr:hypothetical protein F3Y22_tig00110485pilonHSYRG00064 [Hibiscus syriacus]
MVMFQLLGLKYFDQKTFYICNNAYPVWGKMDNYAVGREKRKQLVLMLCQHEADRLEVWAQPLSKEGTSSRPKIRADKWIDMPGLLSQRCHILSLRRQLMKFSTFTALPHWAACSITQALEFLTPVYKGHPRVMAYVLRVLESYPPERVTFFMPQHLAVQGRLAHIDFGFILETSPGGNMRFESAHFKLSHEMTQLLDPSGVMKVRPETTSLCVKGYLTTRRRMNGIINTVLLMLDSGLPCFSRVIPLETFARDFILR